MFKIHKLIAIALAMIGLTLIGQTAPSTAAQATASPTPDATVDPSVSALIRVVHASSDAPNIDVTLDKAASPLIVNLPFNSATDGYLVVDGGGHQVTITESGNPQNILSDDKITLDAGTATTLIVHGLIADKSFTWITSHDDLSPTNGKARLKLSQEMSDVPSVDVITADFKTIILKNVMYKSFDYIDLGPGNYDVIVVPTGKHSPILIDMRGSNLQADHIYSVFATGTRTGKIALKPLLFVTIPVPGFTIPTPAPTDQPTTSAAISS